MAAEVLDKPDKELGKTAQQARLVTATTAFLSGLDVSSADAAGTNAVENNFLAHPELHVMRQRIAEDQSLAESEKQTKLAEVDQLAQQLYQAEGTGAMLAASTAAGMVFPTTAAVVGTGLSAQYYGSITANSGFAGLKQEAKAHPVLTTLAVVPFVPVPKGLGILKPKTPKTTQLEFGFAKKSKTSRLLPGEGQVGTYRDLKATKRNGNLAAHHMPSAKYMEALGVPRDQAIAMNVEHPKFKSDPPGRHQQTRTFGGKSKVKSRLNPRDELAADIHDMRRICQKEGVYKAKIRKGLSKVVKKNLKRFPKIFKKQDKK